MSVKLFELWDMATKIEKRKLDGERRLKKYSLFTRLVLFHRFKGIKKIIFNREMLRSNLVLMALGLARKIRAQKRKLKVVDGRLS